MNNGLIVGALVVVALCFNAWSWYKVGLKEGRQKWQKENRINVYLQHGIDSEGGRHARSITGVVRHKEEQ